MSLLGRIMALFPVLMLLLMLICLGVMVWSPGLGGMVGFLALILVIYGFPLLTFRIHNYFYPLQEGASYISGGQYNPWWGAHQIQMIYGAFPVLEVILRLIPSLFSQWLRLWGSKIGKNVYWTPGVFIADRSLLEIGDNVILGYGLSFTSHLINPREKELILYVRKIIIGENSFIGARASFGPGAIVPANSDVAFETYVAYGTRVVDLKGSIKARVKVDHSGDASVSVASSESISPGPAATGESPTTGQNPDSPSTR